MKNNKVLIIIVISWAITVGIGMVWMADYAWRPGKTGNFPGQINLKLNPSANNLPQLFLFLHPQCPCSKATMHELAELVAKTAGRVNVKVYFYQPESFSSEWTKTDLWFQAKSIPSVTVSNITDQELKNFGVMTSGQTLLYNSDGELVFSGGITVSRGEEGFSNGRKAIEHYLNNGTIPENQTPVFGCALNSPE